MLLIYARCVVNHQKTYGNMENMKCEYNGWCWNSTKTSENIEIWFLRVAKSNIIYVMSSCSVCADFFSNFENNHHCSCNIQQILFTIGRLCEVGSREMNYIATTVKFTEFCTFYRMLSIWTILTRLDHSHFWKWTLLDRKDCSELPQALEKDSKQLAYIWSYLRMWHVPGSISRTKSNSKQSTGCIKAHFQNKKDWIKYEFGRIKNDVTSLMYTDFLGCV